MSGGAKSDAQWRETVLADRARRLAERPMQTSAAEHRRVCICEAGGVLYGIAAEEIARVAPYTGAAPLANADAALVGIVSRSGGFALVFDLASLMTGSAADNDGGGHLLFLRQNRSANALKVTRTVAVTDLELLSADEAVNLPTQAGVSTYGRHAGEHIVSIIDIAALVGARAQTQAGG